MERSGLSSVKEEIDAALKNACLCLEAYSENSEESGRLRDCAVAMNTVSDVLKTVHSIGGELLASSIQEVIAVLASRPVEESKPDQQCLMESILRLGKYLEWSNVGHSDNPVVLLRTIGDLRSSVGLTMLPPDAAFVPDLDAEIPQRKEKSIPLDDVSRYAKRLRKAYQQGLLVWLRGSQQGLALLKKVIVNLGDDFSSYPFGRVWWAARGLAEALYDGGLEADDSIKSFFREGDRQLKRLSEKGEGALNEPISQDLVRTALYYATCARSNGELVQQVKAVFGLESRLVEKGQLDGEVERFLGPDFETFATVAKLVEEDIKTAKGILEIYAHSEKCSPEDLRVLSCTLGHLVDVFETLGLSKERELLSNHVDTVNDDVAREGRLSRKHIEVIADGLVRIESTIKHVEDWGLKVTRSQRTDTTTADFDASAALSATELAEIRTLVTKQAKADLAIVKDLIDSCGASIPGSEQVMTANHLLDQISGSLVIAELGEAAEVIQALSGHLVKLLGGSAAESRLPPVLELLADAVIGIEEYLQALIEQQEDGATSLEGAAAKLTALAELDGIARKGTVFTRSAEEQEISPRGTEVVKSQVIDWDEENRSLRHERKRAINASQQEGGDVGGHSPLLTPLPQDGLVQGRPPREPSPGAPEFTDGVRAEWFEVGTTVPQALVAESAIEGDKADISQTEDSASDCLDPSGISPLPLDHAPHAVREVDPEIAEIFSEEAQEVLETIRNTIPQWKCDPNDTDALTTVRRAFHTLKGSGRLAGAAQIGELAWSVETLLNKVIDGILKTEPAIFILVDEAISLFPSLIDFYKLGRSGEVDLTPLISRIQLYASSADCLNASSLSGSAAIDATKRGVEELSSLSSYQSEDSFKVEVVEGTETSSANRQLGCAPSYKESGASNTQKESVPDVEIGTPLSLEPIHIFGTDDSERRDQEPFRLSKSDSAGVSETSELQRAVLSEENVIRAETSTLLSHDGRVTRVLAEEAAAVVSATDGSMPPLKASPSHSSAQLHSQPMAAENYDDGPLSCLRGTYDPVLLGLFVSEARGHISVLKGSLDCCRKSKASFRVDEDVNRALHTLRGNARTAGIEPIMRLVLDMEMHLKESQGVGQSSDCVNFDAIGKIFEKLEQILSSLETAKAQAETAPEPRSNTANQEESERESCQECGGSEVTQGWSEAQENSVEAGQEGVTATPIEHGELYDPDLIAIFLDEATEILELVDSLIEKWRETPEDKPVIHELQRNLHTLKGGARMSGLGPMGDLSHAIESVLTAAHEERLPVTDKLIEQVQQAEDRLLEMLQSARKQAVLRPAEELIGSLHGVLGNSYGDSANTVVVKQPCESTTHVSAIPAAEHPFRNESRLENETPAEESRNSGQRSSVQVRVSPALVERVANLGGEVSIARARINQQIGVLRFNLKEMDETVERLRQQLRRMEIQTEAQVLFRHEQSCSAEQEQFDPLELDRYSQVQQLSRSLMESVSDLVSIRDLLEGWTSESETLLLQQARVVTELQHGLMAMRLVPFAGIVPRLRHLVRQTARELGKKVELRISGADTEIDRIVLNRLSGCLEHMLRNAMDHGIESEDIRVKRGKSSQGTVSLSVAREASEIVLTVADDGGGLPFENIRQKCVERGLINHDASLSERELAQFILEPAFSTASKVSQISGRGVGMDVVNTEIAQLGGNLEIVSIANQGTTFEVRLPFALTSTQAFIVRVDEGVFAIPHDSVEAVVRISPQGGTDDVETIPKEFTYRDENYRLWHLGELLGSTHEGAVPGISPPLVLVVRTTDYKAAFQVDELSGSQEIMIKPVGPMLSAIRWLSGATILPDGRVVLVLDMPSLVRLTTVEEKYIEGTKRNDLGGSATSKKTLGPTVLVVDDSITVRKVTARLLESEGMRVVTAKDGVDAVSVLQDEIPDIMLLDVEMPRMDGYELAAQVRRDARLKHLPMIMITSRTAEKHRERAMEVGVNRYLGKPFSEKELLGGIRELLA